MENLFAWQLMGDFFKACSLILGYQMIAKKMIRAFVVTEVFSFAVLYVSSIQLVQKIGAEGAVMAHAITYFVYFVTLAAYFAVKLKNKLQEKGLNPNSFSDHLQTFEWGMPPHSGCGLGFDRFMM